MTNIDIGELIKTRLYLNTVSDKQKLLYFIGFRIMIYCDEMHDFGKSERNYQ